MASGSGATDADGALCFAAYVVAADDWGEYTVDLTQDRSRRNDNYQVLGSGPTTDPGTTGPGLTGGRSGGTTNSTNVDTTDSSTGGPTDSSTDDTTLTQSVLDEVGFGPGFELPATDTVTDVAASGSLILPSSALPASPAWPSSSPRAGGARPTPPHSRRGSLSPSPCDRDALPASRSSDSRLRWQLRGRVMMPTASSPGLHAGFRAPWPSAWPSARPRAAVSQPIRTIRPVCARSGSVPLGTDRRARWRPASRGATVAPGRPKRRK